VPLNRTKYYTVNWLDRYNGRHTRRFDVKEKDPILTWAIKGEEPKFFDIHSWSYFFPARNIFDFTCDSNSCFIEKIQGNESQNQSPDKAIFFPTLVPTSKEDNSVTGFSYVANKSEDFYCTGQVSFEFRKEKIFDSF